MARALWIATLLLVGCSVFPASLPDDPDAADVAPGDGGSSPAPSGHKDAGKQVDAASGTDQVDPSALPAGDCGSKTTKSACIDCCNTSHAAGSAQYLQNFGDCVCNANNPGPCATDCATEFCVGKGSTAGSACEACLDTANRGACGTSASTACAANAECAAWTACATTSACDTKP